MHPRFFLVRSWRLPSSPARYTEMWLLLVMPLDETFDAGEKVWDSLILADETVRVAHYVRHCPGIKQKRYMWLDGFQLVSECHACCSAKHVVRKDEGGWLFWEYFQGFSASCRR